MLKFAQNCGFQHVSFQSRLQCCSRYCVCLQTAFGIRALSRSKVCRLASKMELCVESKQHVAVVDAGGSLTVFPGQLECGEILSQHMVSFVHCLSIQKYCCQLSTTEKFPLNHFYSEPHCKRCTSCSNSVCLSVHSVSMPVLCQHDSTQHDAVCTVRQQNVSSFIETKKIFSRDDPFPLKSGLQVTYPLLIAASNVLPYSASTVRASEKSSIMANRKYYTGFLTSHQSRFYAAPNFLKMWIKYLNMSSFGQFQQ